MNNDEDLPTWTATAVPSAAVEEPDEITGEETAKAKGDKESPQEALVGADGLSPPGKARWFVFGGLLLAGAAAGGYIYSASAETVEAAESETLDGSQTLLSPSQTLPESMLFDDRDVPDENGGDEADEEDDENPTNNQDSDNTSNDEEDTNTSPSATESTDDDDQENADLVATGSTIGMNSGIFYLRGTVPSEDIANQMEDTLVSVFGAEAVVNEYSIEPGAYWDPSNVITIVIENHVLFESNGAEIAEDFEPVVALGLQLLRELPETTISVIGHSDANGDERANLDLSERRAQVVIDYWESNGIEPSRLSGIGKGEAEPIADNDSDEGRRLNRRVEFEVNGLID